MENRHNLKNNNNKKRKKKMMIRTKDGWMKLILRNSNTSDCMMKILSDNMPIMHSTGASEMYAVSVYKCVSHICNLIIYIDFIQIFKFGYVVQVSKKFFGVHVHFILSLKK